MDLTVKGSFRKYLKNYVSQEVPVSLNEPKYSHDGDSKEEKLDYLLDPVDPYKSIDNGDFNEMLLEVLSRFAQRRFISNNAKVSRRL